MKWLIWWIVTIFIGTTLAYFVSSDWHYLIGFIAGVFSQTFLLLYKRN